MRIIRSFFERQSEAMLTINLAKREFVFLHKLKNKNQRLLRWSLMLQEHDLDIRHIKGKDNVIADCLSRV